MRKTLSFKLGLLVVSLVISCFSVQIGSSLLEPVHNIDTGLDYANIQGAVDAPETLDGHTILVDAGTYYEHVLVDKALSLIGADKSNTIVDGGGTGNVVTLTADDVSITGFTIKNGGTSQVPECGIRLLSSSCNISNNIIMNNNQGIRGDFSNNNLILGNNISANSYHGIFLYDSDGNNISGNMIHGNMQAGIKISKNSDYNMIYRNIIDFNIFHPCIQIDEHCNYNTIYNNTLTNGRSGIHIWRSYYNTVNRNIIVNNTNCGVWFDHGSNQNNITENIIEGHQVGVEFSYGGSQNRIYHNNFIDNTHQASPDPGDHNIWNNTYPSGGNYWSDYTGVDKKSGPRQDQPGSDGIGDTPYVIDDNNVDNYPFMNQIEKCLFPTIDINPDTLNLKSRRRWISGYIELPESHNVNDIDISTILLNNSISVDPEAPTQTGDVDEDGIPDLMVKFNRDEVILLILSSIDPSEYEHQKAPYFIERTLKLTGELFDGTIFEGYDTIRVIFKHALVH